tara:strand:+ start:20887 stop:21198 length:312 start_codon:yes stop_codon:yes gene_type:complete
MAFNGTEGKKISLKDGGKWTSNYRKSKSEGDPNGHTFGKDILNNILNQEGCVGIRMYYGIDDDGEKILILAGVKANEDDITDLIVDKSVSCPSRCGTKNGLNS